MRIKYYNIRWETDACVPEIILYDVPDDLDLNENATAILFDQCHGAFGACLSCQFVEVTAEAAEKWEYEQWVTDQECYEALYMREEARKGQSIPASQ
jgi:hypothetical protein